jgi:filamentous hemagglutinin
LKSEVDPKTYSELERQIQRSVGVRGKQPVTVSQIDDKKFDYLFGRATGREHNLARTNQNASEMKRLGVPDTPEGHAMLRSHLNDAVQGNSNVVRTYENEWGSFEVRESLFAGPSGKFSKFESTWQVMPDGSRRFSTLIPRGGGKK